MSSWDLSSLFFRFWILFYTILITFYPCLILLFLFPTPSTGSFYSSPFVWHQILISGKNWKHIKPSVISWIHKIGWAPVKVPCRSLFLKLEHELASPRRFLETHIIGPSIQFLLQQSWSSDWRCVLILSSEAKLTSLIWGPTSDLLAIFKGLLKSHEKPSGNNLTSQHSLSQAWPFLVLPLLWGCGHVWR